MDEAAIGDWGSAQYRQLQEVADEPGDTDQTAEGANTGDNIKADEGGGTLDQYLKDYNFEEEPVLSNTNTATGKKSNNKSRACVHCHAAKVKCVKVGDSCERCVRLGLEYVEHVSKQGQRKRPKRRGQLLQPQQPQAAVPANHRTDNEALPVDMVANTKAQAEGNELQRYIADHINDKTINAVAAKSPFDAAMLSPVDTPSCPKSGGGGYSSNAPNGDNPGADAPPVCNSDGNNNANPSFLGYKKRIANNNNSSSSNARNNNNNAEDAGLCKNMEELKIEDGIICESVKHSVSGKDHYGMHCLIRFWVALALNRRSFALLARASFVAEKLGIEMDDILSNQSPFASITGSQPMECAARDLLLPKSQRKTVGPPLGIEDIPFELFHAVRIDPSFVEESVRNRWICIRRTTRGMTRYWTSPPFARDFASTEEIHQVFRENPADREVIDFWVPRSEKYKVGRDIFTHVFLHKQPNMLPFVTKTRCGVVRRKREWNRLRSELELFVEDADLVTTLTLPDLDSFMEYFEIQFYNNNNDGGNYRGGGGGGTGAAGTGAASAQDSNNNIDSSSANNNTAKNKRDSDKLDCDGGDDGIEPIGLDDYDEDMMNVMNSSFASLDGIEFTDIVPTHEMEGFFNLLEGEPQQQQQQQQQSVFP